MFTWLMYILGLAVTVAVLTVVFGKAFGRGEIMPPLVDTVELKQLNAQALERADYAALRFDTVVRGYRQDQVDAVIMALTEEIRSLRAASAPHEGPAEPAATGQ